MIPHLPRPARSPFVTVARIMRRKRKAMIDLAIVAKAKTKPKPKQPSRAFDAWALRTPPMIPRGAAPDSD